MINDITLYIDEEFCWKTLTNWKHKHSTVTIKKIYKEKKLLAKNISFKSKYLNSNGFINKYFITNNDDLQFNDDGSISFSYLNNFLKKLNFILRKEKIKNILSE